MGLFDKGKEEVIESLRRMATELRDENARLTRELESYRKERSSFAKLREVAEKLTEDNNVLLEKVESFAETERKLKQIIEEKNLEISEYQTVIQQKKDEIALKTFAIVARDSDIGLSGELVLTGGLKTSRSINLGAGVITKGNIEAGEIVGLGERNVVHGNIVATEVRSKEECEFKGSIKCNQAILGDKNVLNSPVTAERRLEIGDFCEVKEIVYSKGDIQVGSDSVLQKVMCDGSLKIGARTSVKRIQSKGEVELRHLPM
jgi:bifunctional N-acetylglucosamine-1-phosphate-uridyltransferase/glucosamine-1-phosphate-acetyltransferase GlmU-like protein